MVLDWQILTSAESPDHLTAVITPGDATSAEAFDALARSAVAGKALGAG